MDGGAGSDTFIFTGSVYNTTINNWDVYDDEAVDVVNPNDWVMTDNGIDTVFENGDQSLTFTGVTGLDSDAFLWIDESVCVNDTPYMLC